MKKIAYIIIWSFLSFQQLGQCQEIERLKHDLRYSRSDTNKVWKFRDLAYYYQDVHPDSAMFYARLGVELATHLDFNQGQIWCLYQIGIAYETKNQLDSAIIIYDQAITLSNDALSTAKLLNAKGVAHYFAGKLQDAIYYYDKGFRLSDSLNYYEGISYALNNMAVIYRLQRRHEQALALYTKSVHVKRKVKDTLGIISSLYNKGLAYSYLDRYEESLATLTEALRLAETFQGATTEMPNLQIGLGVAHFNLGNMEASKMHLEAGIENVGQSTVDHVSALAYLGSIDVRKGYYQGGLSRLETAYQLSASSGRKELFRNVVKQRAIAAELVGDWRLAQESWKSYGLISDTLHKESNHWAMEEMQARFELLDKENTIALQELQLEKEAVQKHWYRWFGLFMVCGLLTTILFLRKILKQRSLLKEEICQKEEALIENGLLMREIHHRTKNNLQLLNSILNLYRRNTESEDARQVLQSSSDSIGAIGLLHKQLYEHSSVRNVPFHQYVQDLCLSFQKGYGLDARGIHLKSNCEEFHIDIDQAVSLGLVINELITNAIKHGSYPDKEGKITLRVQQVDGILQIEVNDNGVGLVAKSHNKGMGMKIIEILSRKFQADFEYRQHTSGTFARFYFPFHKLKAYERV